MAHSISRQLAARGRGPKERQYLVAATTQPTTSEWIPSYEKSATGGGMGARAVDYEAVTKQNVGLEPFEVEQNKAAVEARSRGFPSQ